MKAVERTTGAQEAAAPTVDGLVIERRPRGGGAHPTAGTPPSAGEAQRVTKQRQIDIAGYGFALPFLLIYALFMLWPILLGLRMSLFNWSLLGTGTTQWLGLNNYAELLHDPAFWGSIRNTVIFTVLTTPILVVLGLGMALLANRTRFGRWFFRLAFFAPFVLPVSVVALIWLWLYEPGFGLINSYLSSLHLGPVDWLTNGTMAMLSVVIATVWWTLGFNFILYLAGLQEIDQTLYEAASVDGAGAWRRLWQITVPLLGRTTTLVVVLQLLSSLKVFGQIYLMTTGGPNNATRPIVQYIYETGFASYRVGYASAMSYVLFLLILLVSALGYLIGRRLQGGEVIAHTEANAAQTEVAA
jgi:ABC-type sugar transport system permease subunit